MVLQSNSIIYHVSNDSVLWNRPSSVLKGSGFTLIHTVNLHFLMLLFQIIQMVSCHNLMNLCGLGYPDFMSLFYIHTSCGGRFKFQILEFPAMILIWATESNFLSLTGFESLQYLHSLAYFSIDFSLLNSEETDISWIQGKVGHRVMISMQWPAFMTWWREILYTVSSHWVQVCLSQTYFRQLRWRVLGLLCL